MSDQDQDNPTGGIDPKGLRRRMDFTATSWTAVVKAGDPSRPDAREAMERLCNTYWYPLYAYARRRGYDAHGAEDITQEFFYRLLRDNYLAVADRERGKFRSFLLCSMMHFMSNERAKAQAAKRGGGQRLLSLDDEEAEERFLKDPASESSPVKMFDYGWAATLLEEVRKRLRQEYAEARKGELFDALSDFLKEESGPGDYPEMAAKLGMKPGTVAVAVHRLRHRYGETLRNAIAETLAEPTPGAIEAELEHLMTSLSLPSSNQA